MKFRAEQPELFYYLFDDVVDAALNRIGNNRKFAGDYLTAESVRDTDNHRRRRTINEGGWHGQ